MPLDDIDLGDPSLYATRDPHLAWQTLRAVSPVHWFDNGGYWAVTRREEVRRVLADSDSFTSEGGTALSMLDTWDPSAGSMMHATDAPRHRQLRAPLSGRFSARSVAGYESVIASHVDAALARASDEQTWDVAAAFARLPMAVAAEMMDLPRTDIDPLVRLAYASLAPTDTRYADGRSASDTGFAAHLDILDYFAARVAERRNGHRDDLISYLMALTLDDAPLTDSAVVVNCLSLLLGAVVTTSQTISAAMIAIADTHDGTGRFSEQWDTTSLVEEALRWASPVTHFMRRARQDVQLQDVTISAGEAVTAWIGSANRDELVFDRPFVFDPTRSPNRHLTFGSGAHLCLGSHLARLMLRVAFARIRSRVAEFEVLGGIEHLASNEIAGIVALPVRVASWDSAFGRRMRQVG